MNIPKAFNSTADFVLSRPKWQLLGAAVVFAVGLAAVALHVHDAHVRADATLAASLNTVTAQRQAAEHQAKAEADSTKRAKLVRDLALNDARIATVRADSAVKASQALRSQIRTLDASHVVVRVAATDSVPAHDSTEAVDPLVTQRFAADSVTIAQLSTENAKKDAVIASDSIVIRAQSAQLATADTIQAKLHDENAIIRRQLAAASGSKFQTVLHWGEVAAAGYIGYKAGGRK